MLAWILAPLDAELFVRRFLATAPANKLLCFGGDYTTVENVVGHAELARRGLRSALTDLVDIGVVEPDHALQLARRLMRDNALDLFPSR